MSTHVTNPSGTKSEATESDDGLHPPYMAAAIAGVLVFGLYALTLAPTTAFWDTSEYIATGEIMGIPHPPGTRSSSCSPAHGRFSWLRWDSRWPFESICSAHS